MSVVLLAVSFGQYLETTILLPPNGRPEGISGGNNNKMYVTDPYLDAVHIVNCSTNTIFASIDVPEYPSRVAPTDDKVYVSCIEGNRIAVIDGQGDSLLRKIRPGSAPIFMAYSQTSGRLFVSLPDDKEVAVIDVAGDSVITKISTGNNRPFQMVWLPGPDRVLVAVSDIRDSVYVIDVASLQVVAKADVGDGGTGRWCYNSISQLAYQAGYHVLYVLNANGEIVASLPIGDNQVMAFEPRLKLLYLGNGLVINCVTNQVVDTVATQGVDVVCDPTRAKVYYLRQGAHGNPGSVVVVNALTGAIITEIGVGIGPESFEWNPRNSRLYVANFQSSSVSVIRDTNAPAIEEVPSTSPAASLISTTFARGVINFRGSEPAVMFDATGREAAHLRPGSNDVNHLERGVYFLVCGGVRRKVVIVP